MDFDELLTSSARLAILGSLVPGRPLTFTELKQRTGLADGNLHVQAGKLAAAGYVEATKSVRGRRSLTRFKITELGLEMLKLHVRKLQAILASESTPARPRSGSAKDESSQVWS